MKHRLYEYAKQNDDSKLTKMLDELRLDKPNKLWDLSEAPLPFDLIVYTFKKNGPIGLINEM